MCIRDRDYRKQNFTEEGKAYDIIFDIVGKADMIPATKVLKKGGAYLLANPKPFHGVRAFLVRLMTGVRIEARFSHPSRQALTYMKTEVEHNRYQVYIDREMPLSQMVEAHRYVDAGKKIGNLIITMDEEV